uniref:Uncharacterized protein n=1 Tax=Ignisphaera aggregans TaxID=334771 RepID=A0A7C2ZPG9_9CREN
MRIEKLIESLEKLISFDRYELFAAVEEMKSLGFNTLNLLIDLGQDFDYAALSLKYIVSTDELQPIAVVLQVKKDRLASTSLDRVLRTLHKHGGYIYGDQEYVGFLIPVQEESILYVLTEVLPDIAMVLLNYSVSPRIVGYTIDFYQET